MNIDLYDEIQYKLLYVLTYIICKKESRIYLENKFWKKSK